MLNFDCLTGPMLGRKESNQKIIMHLIRVPTSSGNHGKPGKSSKNVPCMENSWNLKNLNNHGKIMEFCEII